MSRTLKSAALWGSARTAVKLTCGFISIKVTAVYLGPAGLALVGQLTNFVGLVHSVLMNGADTAVVKMTAEAEERCPERAANIIGTALRMVIVMAVIVATVVMVSAAPLARWLLNDARYASVLTLFALALPFSLLGRLFATLFTARRRFELVSSADMVGTVLGAAVFIPAAWRYGIWGGLIGAIAVYPLSLLIGAWLGRRDTTTRLLSFWSHAARPFIRPILSFYPMLLVNSAALPLATVFVRAILMEEFGAAQAGLWQATVRLSDTYTMIFLTTLGMYSLPTLSASRNDAEFSGALRRMVYLGAGSMAFTVLALFVCRDLIIGILFTREFAPVRDLWTWRLVGDLFLIAGRPMMNALVVRGRGPAYIGLEVGAGLGMWGLTVALMESQGVAAANMAHAIVWGCSFACLTVLHRRELFSSQ